MLNCRWLFERIGLITGESSLSICLVLARKTKMLLLAYATVIYPDLCRLFWHRNRRGPAAAADDLSSENLADAKDDSIFLAEMLAAKFRYLLRIGVKRAVAATARGAV